MVQETLLIPLQATVAIEQSNPIIRNPKSAEIMTDFDYKFNKLSQAKSSQVGCCLQRLIFDQWMRQFPGQHSKLL